MVSYVDVKACSTFSSATSLCIALSIDLAIKTLLVLLWSVAQFQFHILPGSPIMIVSPAAPAWPLRAFALWPTECVAIPNSNGSQDWSTQDHLLWTCLLQLVWFYCTFFFLKLCYFILFLNLNGIAASCLQCSFFVSECTQVASLRYVTFAPLCFQKLSTVFSYHNWGSGS